MSKIFEGSVRLVGRRRDDGVTAIEYGLIATAMALLVSAAVLGLGPKILGVFSSI